MSDSICSCIFAFTSPENCISLRRLVWFRTGSKGNVWKQGEVTLSNKKPFRVLIEGIRGKSYTGDISLDDLYFQDGNCVGVCSSVLPTARINCGYFGITAAECITKRGCCYDTSIPYVPYCFFHPATCQSVNVAARVSCDSKTKITSQYTCKQKGKYLSISTIKKHT